MTSHVDAGEFRLCKHIHIDMISYFFSPLYIYMFALSSVDGFWMIVNSFSLQRYFQLLTCKQITK